MFSRFKSRRQAYSVYLIMGFASSMFMSVIFAVNMVYQVNTVHLDPLQLVLVGTTLEVTAFAFEIPTGVVADVYSRRLSIIIGMFVMGAGFVLEGAVPLFATIVIAQVLWGIGYTFTSGATEAWITDEIGEEKAGRAFMRAGQIGAIGDLLGIAVGTALGSWLINLPIILGGSLLIGLGGLLIVIMPETGFKPARAEERTTFQSMAYTFRSGLKLVRGRPVLISILTIGLIYGLYSEGFDRLWTDHVLQDFTLPSIGHLPPVVWIGLIAAASAVLGIGLTEIARRRVDTNVHRLIARAVFGLNATMVAGLFTFALSGNFLIALIAYWATSAARQTLGPIYTAWVNQHIESSVRATVISMSSQVDAFGQIAGGPGVGAIGNTWGARAALASLATILSPVLLLLARTIRQSEKAPVVEPELTPIE